MNGVMYKLREHWKGTLGIVLFVAALLVLLLVFNPNRKEYESESEQLAMMNTALQNSIAENTRYTGVQDKLDGAREEILDSRTALYSHFPAELREEDQIMYTVYLEKVFGTVISFEFGTTVPLMQMTDGGILGGLTLTVNYSTSYEGYKNMIKYLATDSRITSIQYSSMDYDQASDTVTGWITLLCYTMVSELNEYKPPVVTEPDTGKINIFG